MRSLSIQHSIRIKDFYIASIYSKSTLKRVPFVFIFLPFCLQIPPLSLKKETLFDYLAAHTAKKTRRLKVARKS